MATQTNLLGYFGKAVSRKRRSQTSITSFFKKGDENEKNDNVIYVGGKCVLITKSFSLAIKRGDKHFTHAIFEYSIRRPDRLQ